VEALWLCCVCLRRESKKRARSKGKAACTPKHSATLRIRLFFPNTRPGRRQGKEERGKSNAFQAQAKKAKKGTPVAKKRK